MMNIYEGNLEICILCRQGAVKGDRYYVRTDTNAVATELLRKIPRYLAHYVFFFFFLLMVWNYYFISARWLPPLRINKVKVKVFV